MNTTIRTNRIKQIRLGENLLVDILNGLHNRQCFYLPQAEGLPEGTQVLRVTHCWERRCLLALVTHESFPEVPDGEHAPIDEDLWFEAVERKDLAQACAAVEIENLRAESKHFQMFLDDACAAMGEYLVRTQPLADSVKRVVAMATANLKSFQNMPDPGDNLLILNVPHYPTSDEMHLIGEFGRMIEHPVVIMPPGYSLESLTDEQLAAIGLKHIDRQPELLSLVPVEPVGSTVEEVQRAFDVVRGFIQSDADEPLGVAASDSEPCEDGTHSVPVVADVPDYVRIAEATRDYALQELAAGRPCTYAKAKKHVIKQLEDAESAAE